VRGKNCKETHRSDGVRRLIMVNMFYENVLQCVCVWTSVQDNSSAIRPILIDTVLNYNLFHEKSVL